MILPVLENYVKDILTTFKDDKRIVLWDLYNEPGGSGGYRYGERSLPLLQKIFTWGRTVNPSQPLSAGVWDMSLTNLNKFQLENSDVITYHTYEGLDSHQQLIDTLKQYGRPMICTEYMARTQNSTFQDIMPMLKKENIGAINWGLIGFFKFDLVAFLFGQMTWLSRVIYAIIGLCGLYLISLLAEFCFWRGIRFLDTKRY